MADPLKNNHLPLLSSQQNLSGNEIGPEPEWNWKVVRKELEWSWKATVM
jgi:hypothetical protein